MSASSGITVSPDLTAKFADALKSDDIRFLKVVIQDESLVHELSVPVVGSFQEDLATLQDNEVLLDDVPAYILARLDPPATDWIAFFYVPETAKVRDKMLYAATRASLLKSLGSTVFTDFIFAMSKGDLTADAYKAHLQHLAAPKPLSAREKEMADVRAAESGSASYEGSRARANHVGTPIGFKWTPEVEAAITELGRGNGSVIVIITVDPETETLLLKSNLDISVDQLSSTIPDSEPSYALFAWPQSHTSPPRRELFFVYSCPSKSPIKHRMLYSSGSAATLHWIKGLLASAAPTTQLASRKIETSEPHELNEEFIVDALGLKNETRGDDGVASIPTEEPKFFARPKGPPKRRP